MKKTAAALFGSVVMVVGAGALGTAATAAGSPYPSTVITKPTVPPGKKIEAGKRFKITIKVGAGNSRPGGYLRVIFNGKKSTIRVANGIAVFRGTAPDVDDDTTKTLKYTFRPYAGSVYKSSKGSARIKVDA